MSGGSPILRHAQRGPPKKSPQGTQSSRGSIWLRTQAKSKQIKESQTRLGKTPKGKNTIKPKLKSSMMWTLFGEELILQESKSSFFVSSFYYYYYCHYLFIIIIIIISVILIIKYYYYFIIIMIILILHIRHKVKQRLLVVWWLRSRFDCPRCSRCLCFLFYLVVLFK